MNLLKILALAIVLLVGFQQWQRRAARSVDAPAAATAIAASPREAGFVALPAFPGASTRSVLLFAPDDCPQDAGRRADELTARLRDRGVIVNRTSHVSLSLNGDDAALAPRVNALMNGPVPIVVVGRRGKANPTFDEVMAELHAGAR